MKKDSLGQDFMLEKCPKCAVEAYLIIDTRPKPYGRIRRRRCHSCQATWDSVEIPIERFQAYQELTKNLSKLQNILSTMHNLIDTLIILPPEKTS